MKSGDAGTGSWLVQIKRLSKMRRGSSHLTCELGAVGCDERRPAPDGDGKRQCWDSMTSCLTAPAHLCNAPTREFVKTADIMPSFSATHTEWEEVMPALRSIIMWSTGGALSSW